MVRSEVTRLDRDEVADYQLSRRTLLGAGGGLAAVLLAACQGGSYTDGPVNTGAAEPVNIGKANIPTPREETVIFQEPGDFQVFDNWNNLIPNGARLGTGFHAICMESLFYLDPISGDLIPWLAESWEMNADFTEYTIKLNPRAKWSDGVPVTSKDFAYSIGLTYTRDDLFRGGGDYMAISEVLTPDDQTAIVKLNEPKPRFHYNFINVLIDSHFDMKPAHIWQDQDPAEFLDNPPVRSGPYVLKEAIPAQKMFVWERNPDYWNIDELDPKPKYAIWHTAPPQADAAALAFERAQTDQANIGPEFADQLLARAYPALVVASAPDPCPRGLFINCDPERGIIGEPKMHWVLSYLVDRERISRGVFPSEGTKPAQWPWSKFETTAQFEFPDVEAKYPLVYDPEQAEKLLDELAPKNSRGRREYNGSAPTIEMITVEPVGTPLYNAALTVRDELNELGVNASLRTVAPAVYDEASKNGEYDVLVGWSCAFRNDPYDVLAYFIDQVVPIGEASPAGNRERLVDEELDAIATQLISTDPNSQEAMDLFRAGMVRFYERLPFIPIVEIPGLQFFNTTFWKNWPEAENMTAVPWFWWGHFIFAINLLEPTGQKEPK